MSDGLKDFRGKASGRRSILHGAKYCRGFIIRPEQMLQLFHDTQPGLPIPKDAEHKGIGVDDAGVDSKIQFYFTSKLAPDMTCFQMKPEYFFSLLVQLSDGLLPLDTELDGIEISSRFTVILLRAKSSHWPPATGDVCPMLHLRYDLGRLVLVDPSKAIEVERKILIQ